MSVSSSASNLYCNEALSDTIVPSNVHIDGESSIVTIFDHSSSPSSLNCNEVVNAFDNISTKKSDLEDESSIVYMFDLELEQMQAYDSIRMFDKFHEVVIVRRDAIEWMFKVNAYYDFSPKTAYLSANYLDRFLLLHGLPQWKIWSWQLLSVACLSLAAKMEETRVPLLLDLQVLNPKFMFKPSTVERMELLVMTALKWRLRVITPFDFLDYFLGNLQFFDTNLNNFSCFLSRASDLILNTCRVIDFLDYTPSTIAAAVVLWAINQNVDDNHTKISFHERISNERVKKCEQLLKVHINKMCQKKADKEHQLLKPSPPSLVGDFDVPSGGRSNTNKLIPMTPSQAKSKDWGELASPNAEV